MQYGLVTPIDGGFRRETRRLDSLTTEYMPSYKGERADAMRGEDTPIRLGIGLQALFMRLAIPNR